MAEPVRGGRATTTHRTGIRGKTRSENRRAAIADQDARR